MSEGIMRQVLSGCYLKVWCDAIELNAVGEFEG